MLTKTLDVSFGDLEPEISWSKGGPGPSTEVPPLEAVWRPMLTWRRVLRTMWQDTIDIFQMAKPRHDPTDSDGENRRRQSVTRKNVQPAVNRQPRYRWGTRRASWLLFLVFLCAPQQNDGFHLKA